MALTVGPRMIQMAKMFNLMALQLHRFAAKICECLNFSKCPFYGSSLVCLVSPANMHQMSKAWLGKALLKAIGWIIVSHARLSAAAAFCLLH